MGVVVIVCYKPKPGKEPALAELMKKHLPRLLKEGLVTDRESIMMEAKDGTVIEVFEWLSEEAIQSAHSNAEVLKMWDEYSEVCDYIPIGNIAEADSLFSAFKPMN